MPMRPCGSDRARCHLPGVCCARTRWERNGSRPTRACLSCRPPSRGNNLGQMRMYGYTRRYTLSWAGGLSGSAEIMQIMHSTCSDRLEPSRAQRSVVRDTAGGSVRGTVLAGGLQKINPRRRAPPGSRAAQRRQRKPTPTTLRATGAGAHSWQRLRLLEFFATGDRSGARARGAPPHQGSGRAAPGLPEPGHRPGWAWHHRVRRPRAAKVARRWHLARKVTEEGATRAAAHGWG